MKNISTGFGLCVAAAAALAYPFVSSLAPSANASAVTAAAAATAAATGQTGPTIVWYGTCSPGVAGSSLVVAPGFWVIRAWTTGRIEARWVSTGYQVNYNSTTLSSCVGDPYPYPAPCKSGWVVISDPSEGFSAAADINFDENVDGADLGVLLALWGNAPRQDIPPSDCPLALINP